MRYPLNRFIDAMRSDGLAMHVGEPAADGQLHRFRVEGDKSGSLNGWYVLHPGTPAFGAFGSWRTGQSHNWSSVKQSTLSDAERRTFAQRAVAAQSARDKAQAAVHTSAAARASRVWKISHQVEVHAYLSAKGVRALGIRQFGDKLVIPLRDSSGVLWSLQFIDSMGRKRFLTGGRKRGCYFSIGLPSQTLCICEGFATAASVYMSTGIATAVAFDAGNLRPVASALRKKFPNVKIIIAADNDIATPGNPGLTRAIDAARAVGGLVAVPNFEEVI